MGFGERGILLYGTMYCCKASEALGLPLCIMFVLSILSSLVLILNVQMAAIPNRLHLYSAPY